MSKPVIADKNRAVLELEAGTYYYCTCGQSKNQPFCDGGHKGTDFTPMQFKLEEKKRSHYVNVNIRIMLLFAMALMLNCK